eukprot:TRINITY_DN11300_c0_g1_i2.p1 TRINITY_DN11300_c0_g1~~TRINITY_DN11300_c0_g1_i2.p1  ORF type:complete len:109 (-),score=67.92 TRINITY_DN11300_c0_g1_i2:180-506(-)
MRYVAAALLAALGGQDINAANLKKIITAGGADVDAAELDKVVAELAGKDVSALIEEGLEKISSVPAGGGAAPSAGGAAPAAADAAPAAAAKEEEEEEEDDDMGFGLFD